MCKSFTLQKESLPNNISIIIATWIILLFIYPNNACCSKYLILSSALACTCLSAAKPRDFLTLGLLYDISAMKTAELRSYYKVCTCWAIV